MAKINYYIHIILKMDTIYIVNRIDNDHNTLILNIPQVYSKYLPHGKHWVKVKNMFGNDFILIANIYSDNDNDNKILLSAHLRKGICAELNSKVNIVLHENNQKLDKLNINIEFSKIIPTSNIPIKISKNKIIQMMKNSMMGAGINTKVHNILYDIEHNVHHVVIIKENSTHMPIEYNGQECEIDKIINNVNNGTLIDEDQCRQSTNIFKEYNLNDLGIGGLDEVCKTLFRRSLATRTMSSNEIDELGIIHAKGVLIHGPPGVGKTLLARKMSEILESHEPKIVSGSQIVSKYVGESAENIRKLFKDAEDEYALMGNASKLHVIIIDEFEVIARRRGSGGNVSDHVNDSIVTQILAKMDGVEPLNNIIIFALTNHIDMIDEALLRPGRFGIMLNINLPDYNGRIDIFNIHLKKLKDSKKLDGNINIIELVEKTHNCTGADIQGLITDALSFALERRIQNNMDNLIITMNDFHKALQQMTPIFRKHNDKLDIVLNGTKNITIDSNIIDMINNVQNDINSYINNESYHMYSICIVGDNSDILSYVGALIAKNNNNMYLHYYNSYDFIGFAENVKATTIKEIYINANISKQSIILFDHVNIICKTTNIPELAFDAINKQPTKNKMVGIYLDHSGKEPMNIYDKIIYL